MRRGKWFWIRCKSEMINLKTLGEVRRLRERVKDLKLAQSKSNEILSELVAQNETLRRDFAQERQKRADYSEKIELRLRLQIS